jgi:hypothetical protein
VSAINLNAKSGFSKTGIRLTHPNVFKDSLFTPTETTGVPMERLQPNHNCESDEIQDDDMPTPKNAQEEHQYPTIPLGCRQNRFHQFLSLLEQEINAKLRSVNCPQQQPHVKKTSKQKSVHTDLAERCRGVCTIGQSGRSTRD